MDYTLSGKPDYEPGLKIKSYGALKRVIDLTIACFMMIFAALPLALIALAVKATSKGPAIFRQERVGRNGVPFTCYKFRTMRNDAPHYSASFELKNADKYITPLGAILRKTSLDELPQLINIIRGDMSFVGPRPLIPSERAIHTERYKKGVYYIRPGITGLAQINGRDNLGGEAKVGYDEEYLKNYSLKQDLDIVFGTVFAVLKAKDVVEGENDNLR